MSENSESRFCYPVRTLRNERITLTPFNLRDHTSSFVKETAGNYELFKFMTWGPFPSDREFQKWYQDRVGSIDGTILFAVFINEAEKSGLEKGQTVGTFGGIIGLEYTNTAYASTEIGLVVILPRFHRTFVSTNAIGLLLQYTLDAPLQGGLGLRRVQWQANIENEASIRAAKRLGFVFEGVARWQRILPAGKGGIEADKLLHQREVGMEGRGNGRHSAILALCWDDWAEKREQVMRMMMR